MRRREQGLQTHFDEALNTVLQPALISYELDRAAGFTSKNTDFQSAGIMTDRCFNGGIYNMRAYSDR